MDTISGVSLESLSPERMQSFLYALGALGLVYCFAGYKLFRLVLGISGFLVAGFVAATLSAYMSAGDALVMGVCGVFGGLCGAMALTFVYKLGVFGLGCMAAVLVSQQVSTEIIDAPQWFIVLGAGFVGGAIALLLERPAMTLATAAIGAWLSTFAAYVFLMGGGAEQITVEMGKAFDTAPRNALWLYLGWAALAMIGASVQFNIGKKRQPE